LSRRAKILLTIEEGGSIMCFGLTALWSGLLVSSYIQSEEACLALDFTTAVNEERLYALTLISVY